MRKPTRNVFGNDLVQYFVSPDNGTNPAAAHGYLIRKWGI